MKKNVNVNENVNENTSLNDVILDLKNEFKNLKNINSRYTGTFEVAFLKLKAIHICVIFTPDSSIEKSKNPNSSLYSIGKNVRKYLNQKGYFDKSQILSTDKLVSIPVFVIPNTEENLKSLKALNIKQQELNISAYSENRRLELVKRNVNKITEAILAGKDIRKSLSLEEDLDESLKESVTPDSKDIARAERLKTQDPKFAAKMSKSITDPVKWERRYQAIKDVCGEDSEQAKAFNKAHELKNNSETGQLFSQIAEWFKKDFVNYVNKNYDSDVSDLEILNSSMKLVLSYNLEDLSGDFNEAVKTTLSISDIEIAIDEYNNFSSNGPDTDLDISSLIEKCKDKDVYEDFIDYLFSKVPVDENSF